MSQSARDDEAEKSTTSKRETAAPADGPVVTLPSPRALVGVVLMTALVGAALSAYADLSALGASLVRFDLGAAVAALGLSTGNFLIRGLRWQGYLRLVGVRIGLPESLVVFLAGFTMTVTPGKLGEVLKSALLKEVHDTPIAESAPVVVAERVTDLVALLLLVGVGAPLASGSGWPPGAALAVSGLALLGAVIVVALVASPPVAALGLALLRRLPVPPRLVERVAAALGSLRALTRPGPLLAGTLAGVVAWGLQVIGLVLVVAGFPGAGLGVDAAAVAYGAPMVAGVVALLPGGLGVTEAGMTGFLQALGDGITAPVAVAATLVTRLVTMWWAVAVGVVALAVHRWVFAPERVGSAPPPR